jgi:hypothetical protein
MNFSYAFELKTKKKNVDIYVDSMFVNSKCSFSAYNIKISVIINCGAKLYKDEEIGVKMNGIRLQIVETSKYLGVKINKKNYDKKQVISKFRKVQKCFY